MSLPIVVALRAEQDMTLQYQWYLEQAGTDVAERYLESADRTIKQLSKYPDLGILRRFQAKELRDIRSTQIQGAFDRHLIFYRATDVLSIERVIHGSRDLPRRILEEPGID